MLEAGPPHGNYAELYIQLIFFFLDLYRATGDKQHLESTRMVADEAIALLWHKSSLFRGHPNKHYYEAMDGVGLLLEALLKLNQTNN